MNQPKFEIGDTIKYENLSGRNRRYTGFILYIIYINRKYKYAGFIVYPRREEAGIEEGSGVLYNILITDSHNGKIHIANHISEQHLVPCRILLIEKTI